MKKSTPRKVTSYMLNKVTGTFTGFVVGMWATGLVSHFFETRGFKNLWGLTSRKTVVDKQTFGLLEWLASAIVGYLVFEVVIRVIKTHMAPRLSLLKIKSYRYMIRNDWHVKMRSMKTRFLS